MDEITQVGAEKSKISPFTISGSSKVYHTHKHSNTSHGLNFHHNFFLNARNSVLYEYQ